jgi:hypothetical protein
MTNAAQAHSAGLIIRQKQPTNLEPPYLDVESYLTPNGVVSTSCLWATPWGR